MKNSDGAAICKAVVTEKTQLDRSMMYVVIAKSSICSRLSSEEVSAQGTQKTAWLFEDR
jgi:hypothetical protein